MDELDKLIEDFKQVRSDYEYFINNLDYTNKDTVTLFENRFNSLLASAAFLSETLFRLRTIHDDKAATAKKAVITKRYSIEEKSFSKCEVLAAGDEEYLEFLRNRSLYYSKWELLSQVKTSIEHYLREIAHRIR